MASELGVQTIQHTNGTDAMTIDSSGRILMPATPAFHAVLDADTAFSSGVSTVICGTTRINRGNHYNTSTGEFTCPVDGVYHFTANITGGSGTAAMNYFGVYFIRDRGGADEGYSRGWEKIDAGYAQQSKSITTYFQAGDKIRIVAELQAAATLTASSSDNNTEFSGFLVG